jgi:hypothetical protein
MLIIRNIILFVVATFLLVGGVGFLCIAFIVFEQALTIDPVHEGTKGIASFFAAILIGYLGLLLTTVACITLGQARPRSV